MPNFAEKVEGAVDNLTRHPPCEVDENEFIDASRLVYDGVRDIRRAVLMNRVSDRQHVWKYDVHIHTCTIKQDTFECW